MRLKSHTYLVFLFSFLILLSSHPIYSQVSSTLGRFEADFVQGCDPLTVTVTTNIPLAAQPLWQFEGRGSAEEGPATTLSHTYTAPGRYVIYLTVQNLVPRQDSLAINVFDSRPPEFQVFGCARNAVSVSITDQYYDRFNLDYGDGTVINVAKNEFIDVYTYASPGTYTITVRGIFDNSPNNCASASQDYVASDTLIEPEIDNVSVTDDGFINLLYDLPQNLNYRLEVAQGNAQLFQFYSDLDNSSNSLEIRNLDPFNVEYCFRITGIDNCTSERAFSNTVCSITNSVEAQNNQNLIEWASVEQGGENYRISRNATINFIQIAGGTQSFTDQQVDCNIDYCYTVTILYPDGSTSTSPTNCVTSFSNDIPPAITNLSISIINEGVQLSWPADAAISESLIEQFEVDGTKIFEATTDQNQVVISTDLNDNPQTCYSHSYTDVCGNQSLELPKVCSILLQGIGNPDGSITLVWNRFSGWENGVENYILQKFDNDGNLLETIDVAQDTIFTDPIDGNTDQILQFLVTANPSDGQLLSSRSNTITVARKAQVHFPDAFSPNGDGLNDEFKPTYLFVNTYDLRIYNRWGELIFTSTNPDIGWDGRLPSGEAPNQPYTYHAVVTDFRGLNITRSGIFLLVR